MQQRVSDYITEVSCPSCEEMVSVSLPCSAENVTVRNGDDTDGGVESSDGGSRQRDLQYRCAQGHPVTVLFEW